MVNVNAFHGGTDNEILESAIASRDADGIVYIPARVSELEPERNWWLLDRAILIPENTTVILQNCKIKLSDRCRDNFFRSANCGMGVENPERIHNIHLKGEGLCILEGADNPRATGDGSKILANPCPYLPEDIAKYASYASEQVKTTGVPNRDDMHAYSYGTDADVEGESHCGDWRGIGVLFANVENFTIENLHLIDTHGWGISLEACSHGQIRDIAFADCMSLNVNGMLQNMENQDGIDIRNGCHHINISDISGHTGDDVVALTAIVPDKWTYKPGGSMCSTHVMPNDWNTRDRDIHDISIRNVFAYSTLCRIIRLLPCNSHIWNVNIDNVVDITPDTVPAMNPDNSPILLGDLDRGYGRNLADSLKNIAISNVSCHRSHVIDLMGYLKDSTIRNIVNRQKGGTFIRCYRPDGMNCVTTENIHCFDGDINNKRKL